MRDIDGLSKYPTPEELERWARSERQRIVPRRPAPKRRWPNPGLVGASIFLFRNLPRIR